ncbi:MAG: RluA family pseudouridine synthase [Desulfocapsa sp.]|nr:RluA family pseudouridine synthase [Desulfocapsa sp.]
MENNDKQKSLQCSLTVKLPAIACQLLADTSGLPKERIKHAMAKGAVWLTRSGNKERRLRKAKFKLKPGDHLQLFYNPDILAQTPPQPFCLEEHEHYSVWFKPPWLLSQGTRYGDHCSLLRLAEKSNTDIDFKLIHRLDREASGLMLLAHNRNAAMLLSKLFQENKIEKRYFAEVDGNPQIPQEGLQLTTPLDDKPAKTEILTAHHGNSTGTTLLDIRLHSGRLHQIRRHLADWGHSVLGDPKYGNKEQKTLSSLHLCAWKVSFLCPFTQKKRSYQVPVELMPSFLSKLKGRKKFIRQ